MACIQCRKEKTMSIQLDTTRLAGSIQMSAPDLPAPTEQGKALAALLGGASLTVTSAEMSDLEALVAKLKSDSERTRFLMLMTSLTSIGQSLDAAQKSARSRPTMTEAQLKTALLWTRHGRHFQSMRLNCLHA